MAKAKSSYALDSIDSESNCSFVGSWFATDRTKRTVYSLRVVDDQSNTKYDVPARHYQDFHELHNSLKGRTELPPMPPKSFWRHYVFKTRAFHEERKDALRAIVEAALRADPNAENAELATFLGLNEQNPRIAPDVPTSTIGSEGPAPKDKEPSTEVQIARFAALQKARTKELDDKLLQQASKEQLPNTSTAASASCLAAKSTYVGNAWQTDFAYVIGYDLKEIASANLQMLDGYTSVTQAVDALNKGRTECQTGICVVFSKLRSCYYAVARHDQLPRCANIFKESMGIRIEHDN